MRHFRNCLDPTNCWCEVKHYSIIFGIGLMILIGEVVGGIASESLALLADASHVGADVGAVIVSIIVASLVKAGRSEGVVRTVGAKINAFLLLGVSLGILWEAAERMKEPRNIESWIMVSIATLGAIGNWVQQKILAASYDESGRTITHHLMALHINTDLYQSLGVLGAAFIIWMTGWSLVDPIISIAIGLFMSFMAIQVLRGRSSHHHGHHDHHH